MTTPTRRGLLEAGLAAPFVCTAEHAFAAEQITVADVGGAPGAAIRKAFHDPFEKQTGVKVVGVAHEADRPSSSGRWSIPAAISGTPEWSRPPT